MVLDFVEMSLLNLVCVCVCHYLETNWLMKITFHNHVCKCCGIQTRVRGLFGMEKTLYNYCRHQFSLKVSIRNGPVTCWVFHTTPQSPFVLERTHEWKY
jgi:hypothetical protein